MKNRIIVSLIIFIFVVSLVGCTNDGDDSYFKITFIDVGHGDSALIECDNHFMLIDGGKISASNEVERVLKDNQVTKLDVLVVSHLHEDHIGGLVEGLNGISSIKHTVSNSESSDTECFDEFKERVSKLGSRIKVPKINSTYNLGRAEIKIIDVRNERENDSLVLLITYGNTSFLFAGDMEQNQESRVCEMYGDNRWNISLLKVAHHGSKTSTSIRFLRMLMPKYAVISVGKAPPQETLEKLEQADVESIFRTDIDGDIIVMSDGKDLKFETTK